MTESQMSSTMEQASTNILMNFLHFTKHFCQSWPVLRVASASGGQSFGWPSKQVTKRRQANEIPKPFLPSLSIP